MITPSPDAPLPVARLARLAVLGQSPMASALGDLLTNAGRSVCLTATPVARGLRLAEVADVVFVCLPWEELTEHRAALAEPMRDVVAAIATVPGPASVMHEWPGTRLVGALQQFTPAHLELAGLGLLHTDAPVIGDDREATDLVEAIVDELPGFSSVYGGALRDAAGIEGLAALVREAENAFGRPVGFRLGNQRIRFIP